MYAKITDRGIEEYDGSMLQYTKIENGMMYYVQIINPDENDLNEAGYYRILPEKSNSTETKDKILREGTYEEKTSV